MPSAAAKKCIDASVPGTEGSSVKNISEQDKKKIIAEWDRQAANRAAIVARECAAPTKATRTLVFQLQQFGRYWQASVIDGKKLVPLLGAPSLLSSALDALEDAMLQRANRA
jgi:hypothetical protein